MTHAGMRSKATVLRRILLLTVFLAVSQPIVSAQVLNMSHDLVPLGIASQNLAPNVPSQDARPLIQAAVEYVQSHPVQVLTLDKGNYYLLTSQQPSATLVFPGLSNMTVDLAGSTIYFNGPLLPNGIMVFGCNNLTLTNFQTDFLNPPYTHVQLTSVDAAQRLLKYQTLPDWPDPSAFNNLSSPFGGPIEGLWAALFRNGAIIPGTTRTLLTGPITGNTLTLTQDGTPWTTSAMLSTLQPGDTVVVTARGGGPPLLVWESDSITLSNITIYGSPTWAVSVYATSNSTVDGVRVMPRPGTGLVGSNADGIHFNSVRENNHLRNSYVTRTLDDALIMDNQHVALVVTQTGPRQLSVTRHQYLRFPNGTAVNFVDPATTMEIAGATVVSQNPTESTSPVFNGQVDLTFDIDLPPVTAGMGMVYAAPAMRGQGSTIEDNVVEDTYGGRGVWVSGAQGLTVQRNVLRRTSLAGIIVSQSTDPFDIGDLGPPAHDITISDNSLEGALGPAANGTGAQVALASISVVSTNNQQFGFASGASNTNISIVNNTILDSGRSAIWVGELNGGTIQNNRIGTWNQHPELPIFGIPPPFVTQVIQDFASPVVIHYSSGVTSQGNIFLPASGVGAIVVNPYGGLSVQGADLIGNTISNLQSNAVIQLGGTPGGPGSFAEIDFQGFDIGAGNTLTVRSGAPGQNVFLYNAGTTPSSVGGNLLAQGGGGALSPGIYLNSRNGVTVLPGGNVSGVSGLTIDTLGSASTEGQNLVNQGVIDGGSKLQLNSARVTGGGAYKGNVIGVSTFGNANNPVNGAHFLSNGLQIYPSSGNSVSVLVNDYGSTPQVFNLMMNGNASLSMPSAWPAGATAPRNNAPVPAGSTLPSGTPNPGYGGGSSIFQASGSLTLLGGVSNDFVFPGGVVFKAAGTLDLNGVVINNGWVTSGQPFQGVFLESPNIVQSAGNLQVLTNNLNWVNFSTFPHAHVRTWTLIRASDGSAQYVPADSIAPHLNTYSTLSEAAANGQCYVCLVNGNPVNMQ